MKIRLLLILISMIFFSCTKDYAKLANIERINASSILNENKNVNFYPHNILKHNLYKFPDNNITNPWIEGKTDEGIGEYIEIQFDRVVTFDKIAVINGFNNEKWFNKNNRIKNLILEANGKRQTLTLKDTIKLKEYELDDDICARSIKIIIGSIYKGTEFNDTCLSHIEFLYKKVKIDLLSMPKYRICMIKPLFNYIHNCPPGGDPELIFQKNGSFISKSMKEYGFADKGYNITKGTYSIDITTLKKRKIEQSSSDEIPYSLWSAKITMRYNNGKKVSGFIFDNGIDYEFNEICGGLHSSQINE
ncbi:MAG: hypothetical protein GY754_35860 [bacterium]|nr:hypothetical protein [bacterium]